MAEPKVHIELTLEQARALERAADFYVRIAIGQLEEIAHLVRMGEINPFLLDGEPKFEDLDALSNALAAAKATLGLSSSSSLGISNERVTASARRAWEIKKVVAKTIAEYRDPSPSFRCVNYDGLLFRLTSDPAPSCAVLDHSLLAGKK